MRPLRVLAAAVLLLACGCASAKPVRLPADIAGRWVGTWTGYGNLDVGRVDAATLELNQNGDRAWGRILLDGSIAADSVPKAVRLTGLTGARVSVQVKGSKVVVRHELGGELFTADFDVSGDHMEGRVRHVKPYLTIILDRVKSEEPVPLAAPVVPPAPTPVAPTVAVAPAPAPAPAAPEPPPAAPVAPPPPSPPPVAVAPPVAAPAPPPAAQFASVTEVKRIQFEFDSAVVRPADARILDANAQWLREHPDTLVLIQGHCDERGTSEYNLALGERRARAARDYLVSREVQHERITITSYGAEQPLCREHNEACWRLNRRAEFLVKPR